MSKSLLPPRGAPRESENAKRTALWTALFKDKSGGDLLSQAVSCQVPSALEGLTSVFGMGTGVTPPPWPPKSVVNSGRRSEAPAP